MAQLENEEFNRELCALAFEDTVWLLAAWSPETQEQILAEWEDWQEANTNKPEHIAVVIVVEYLVVQTVR